MKRRWSPGLALLVAASLPLGAQVSLAQPSRKPAPSASSAPPPPPPAPGSASAPAPAQSSVSAEILILHASNSGGGIDPKVRDLPQLKKPPFSSYNTYRVLGQNRVTLPLGRDINTPLPNGGAFRLSLKEVPAPERFKLATSITQPDGRPFLPLMEVSLPYNEYFFVGAQSHRDENRRDGKLVLAVRLVKLEDTSRGARPGV